MSVSKYNYTGFAYKLADDNTYDTINNKLEELAESQGHCWYDDLEFDDSHIRIVSDGMCGTYIYLFYVLSQNEDEDYEDHSKSYPIDEFLKLAC